MTSAADNRWHGRGEAAGYLLLALGVFCLGWFHGRMPLPAQVLLAGGLVLLLAVLWRHGWVLLCGPVLLYDLARLARQNRQRILRLVYVLFLFLALHWTYLNTALVYSFGEDPDLPARRMALFAESFFYTFMVAQFAVVVLLTPAFTAGAIAQEKERKSLEFLLAADLSSREIVLSKLLARLATLAILLLSGLPVLSLTQLWGGVDPNLVLSGFAAAGLTLASLGSLSMLHSVYALKPRDALLFTYLTAGAYLGLSGLLGELVTPAAAATVILPAPVRVTLGDVADSFNAGNLFLVLLRLARAVEENRQLADSLPHLLRNYAVFHGLVTLVCVTWAVARLRPVAARQTHDRLARPSWGVRLLGRPRVGLHPMLWKEVFVESELRLRGPGWAALAVLAALSFLPAVLLVSDPFWQTLRARGLGPYTRADLLNYWVRGVGTAVGFLLLLGVGVRAAGSLTGERERQTLDSLLTTSLPHEAILFAKWLGSLASVRWGLLWLGLIWLVGLAGGGLSWDALLVLLAACVAYGVFLASLGLWFSATCRTTLRASLWTLLTLLAVMGGQVVAASCCCIPIAGLPMPATLALLAYPPRPTHATLWGLREGVVLPVTVVGMMGYAVAALFLWRKTNARFARDVPTEPFALPLRRLEPLPPRPPAILMGAVLVEEEVHGKLVLADEKRDRRQPPPRIQGAVLLSEERPDEAAPDGESR